MERKAFLDMEPPPGYIAGLGRGATGFSTKAEGALSSLPVIDLDNDSNGMDREDTEAQNIFDDIDRQLAQRGKKRSRESTTDLVDENNLKNSQSDIPASKVVVEDLSISDSIREISSKFTDVKQDLKNITLEEWQSIPESIDLTKRNKRLREERQAHQRFYRNSDALSLGLLNRDNTDIAIDMDQIARAKDMVLEKQLQGKANEIESIDKSKYLLSLNQMNKNDNEVVDNNKKFINSIGDYKKTRLLFAKMRQTNPKKVENWIASARLEFDEKKFARAKELIQQGCDLCPYNEEIWLVNLEINFSDISASKAIVADGIKHIPSSLNLWLKAVYLESDNLSKMRVLRKALEFLPTEEVLWDKMVDYEEDHIIKTKILQKATQLIPKAVNLWLKLSQLEKPAQAQKLLEEARNKVDENKLFMIWIASAILEEKSTENEVKIQKIITNCIEEIGHTLTHDEWIQQAINCETDQNLITAKILILTWLDKNSQEVGQICQQADDAFANGHCEVARSLLLYATNKNPKNLNIWHQVIQIESKTKNENNLFLAFELALSNFPNEIELYLMYAKHKWKINDISKARSILFEGMQANPTNEELWFAAIKLEDETGSEEIAGDLFEQCKSTIPNPSSRIWYKQIHFERKCNNTTKALGLLEEAIKSFPLEPKLYLQKGQIYEDINDNSNAQFAYEIGTKSCPHSYPLWIHLSTLYQKSGKLIKARSTLDESLTHLPECEELHLARVKLETQQQQPRILAKSLRKLPHAPLLLSLSIELAPESSKKSQYAFALKASRDHPIVTLTIAKDLWNQGAIDKAKIFFEASLKKGSSNGDVYIYYYAFLLQNGTVDQMKLLEANFEKDEPRYGKWAEIKKSIENDGLGIELLREEAVKVLKGMKM
ncbi:U4/U6-U5 snRNP complex subunit [Martiniozyma asiatica (nom. inval.)]|nr:U4/U6-U5 snRNP complex subunit [Martiniozyma asiatica]